MNLRFGLGQRVQAFTRWLDQWELASGDSKPTKASKNGAPAKDTGVIGGPNKSKRAPRLTDDLLIGQQRTQAKAAIKVWQQAEDAALNVMRPRRDMLMAVYQQITRDNYLTGQINTLKNKVLSEGYVLVDDKGEEKPELLHFLERPWFYDFMSRVLDTDFYGHTLINFDYPNDQGEFFRFDLIPRGNVVPEQGMVLLKPTDDVGIPFRGVDADYTRLLLEVRIIDEEGKDSLGILNKAAPEVLWKRYSRADWARRSEKFGMPIITMNTSASEEADLDKREKMLANLGSNGWGLIDTDEKITVTESSNTDGSKIYKALADACNDELAYLITGQTATSQETGSRAGGEVHERVQEHYIQTRMRFLSQYINYELFPFLKLWGYPLEGLQFKWVKWVEEAKAKAAGPQPTPGTDPEKDTPDAPNARKGKKKGNTGKGGAKGAGDRTTLATPSFSLAGACSHAPATTEPEPLNLAAADTNLLKLFTDVLKKVHSEKPKLKKMLKSPEFLAMYRATAEHLSEGLENGYGQKIASVKWNSPDAVLLAKLTESLYVFSANKDYQLLTELNGLLVDGDKVRSYPDFEAEALALHQDYNVNWLRTEYDTAIATGQMASKWVSFQDDKDNYYLKYTTAGDERVRPEHHELDGITLPVDDSFWNTHFPPLGWKCRCNVTRVPRAGRKPTDEDRLKNLTGNPPDFGHNAGKTGVVFPDSHTYNNVPEDEGRILRNTARNDAPKPKK